MSNVMNRSLLALIICGAGWLSPAIAQSDQAASGDQLFSYAAPLSKDIMGSTGKWTGGISLTDPTERGTGPGPASAASPAMQFKMAEPAWIGVLDIVGLIASSVRINSSNLGVSGKIHQPTPRVNSPLPPSD